MQSNTVNRYIYYYIVFFAAFSISLCFGMPLFADPDTGWHLKAGELIWNTWSIPLNDPWSFSSTQQWYNLSWSWDILTYLIYSKFGFDGMFVFGCLLFAGICTAIYTYARYITDHDDTSAIVATLSGLIIFDLLYFRPQLLTYFFALGMLILLSNKDKRSIFLCPIIMMFWANVHGSFLSAYSLFFAFFVQAFVEKDKAWQKQLIICGFLSSVAIFINPLGYKILIGAYRTMGTSIKSHILEWFPIVFGNEYSFTLVLIIMIITGGFLNKSTPIAHRILGLMWLLASLHSKRYFGYFAIFAVPYLCYTLLPIIKSNPAMTKFNNKALIATLCAIIVFPIGWYSVNPKRDHLEMMPVDAINFLSKNCEGAHVFNDYGNGGYIILLGNAKFKHFIDGRASTVFDEELLSKYAKGAFETGEFEPMLKDYDVNAAMIRKKWLSHISIDKYFSSWQKVYEDKTYIVYQKKGSGACKIKH